MKIYGQLHEQAPFDSNVKGPGGTQSLDCL